MTQRISRVSMSSMNRRTLLKGAAAAGAASLALPIPNTVRAQENLRIAFSVPGLHFPFFVHMTNLAEQYAESLGGIELIILDGQQSGQASSSKQTADLEAMIVEGVDGLVISPNDVQALVPGIEAVLEAGIPVVTVDRNVTGVATLGHVGADNVEGGRVQGRYLIEILPDGGDVFELQGAAGASAAIDRHAGFDEIMQGQDLINVVVSQDGNFQRANAIAVMEASLAANPNPAAVVCANDEMAFGAVEVAEANGLAIPIIGFDALPEALQMIQAGSLNATIEQFPGQQAIGAMDVLLAFINDGTEPEEHDIFLTPALINADNLGEAERAEEAGITPAGSPEATPTS